MMVQRCKRRQAAKPMRREEKRPVRRRAKPDMEPRARTAVELRPEPNAEPNEELRAESHAEPYAESHAEPNAELRAEPNAEPHADPHVEVRAGSNAELRAESCAGQNAEPCRTPHPERHATWRAVRRLPARVAAVFAAALLSASVAGTAFAGETAADAAGCRSEADYLAEVQRVDLAAQTRDAELEAALEAGTESALASTSEAAPASASEEASLAAPVTMNGFTSKIVDGAATITGYLGTETDVEIPAAIGAYPVRELGEFCFANETFSSIVIPDTVTTIASHAFSCCTALTEIDIPDSVTSLGGWAFFGCTSLASASLPSGLSTVPEHAFDSCPLQKLRIPGNVTAVGDYAFYDNVARRVCIPESVDAIGANAFHSDVTERVILAGSPSSLGSSCFYLVKDGSIIYCLTQAGYDAVLGDGGYGYYSPTHSTLELAGGCEVAGDDRYETALAVACKAYAKGESECDADGVIVATGANFPDALAATALAGLLDYPIVLTKSEVISTNTVKAITRLTPNEIIIVGGEGAVCAEGETYLKKLYGEDTVRRIAGADRYGTAVELYEAGCAAGAWGSTAIIATGENYPDALSASAFAFEHAAPVFLCGKGTGLDAASRAALRDGGFSRIVVVGGERAVSDAVFQEAAGIVGTGNVVRLAGDDRYETSARIAEFTLESGAVRDRSCVATGANFPDALVGGVLAGKGNALLLLADEGACDALQALNCDSGAADTAVAGESATLARIAGGMAAVDDDPEAELASSPDAGASLLEAVQDGACDGDDETSFIGRIFFLGGERALPQTVRDAALSAAGLK